MIFRKGQTDDTLWAIWKIDETKEQLLSLLDDQSLLDDILRMKSEPRMIERLAVRVLFKQLTGKEDKILYRPSGSPYVEDESVNISISHTRGYVAVVLNKKQYLGIDIQYITGKVKRIRHRFISPDEYIDPGNELIHLLLHWSAKETLYKALRLPGIDLLKELYVLPFKPESQGMFSAIEKLTDNNSAFDIHYLVQPDFVFTITSK
ncbi:4'-phosphopantetheinyl transferase family protein [Viscerimonas tarda]